jgi:hypothetical protein
MDRFTFVVSEDDESLFSIAGGLINGIFISDLITPTSLYYYSIL